MVERNAPGPSPYDSWLSAGVRFLTELVAWVAGPWAAGKWLGGWAVVPAAAILVALPAVFSTPADKEKVIVPTPGPMRLLIELALGVVAVVSAWYAWPPAVAIPATTVVAGAAISGWRRTRWLMQGAPPVELRAR